MDLSYVISDGHAVLQVGHGGHDVRPKAPVSVHRTAVVRNRRQLFSRGDPSCLVHFDHERVFQIGILPACNAKTHAKDVRDGRVAARATMPRAVGHVGVSRGFPGQLVVVVALALGAAEHLSAKKLPVRVARAR